MLKKSKEVVKKAYGWGKMELEKELETNIIDIIVLKLTLY